MTTVEIRPIELKDAETISELSQQLGYSISSSEIKEQLKLILEEKTHSIFVAVKNNLVIGYIHCFKAIRLTSSPFMEIAALVVNESERGNGIGKLLIQKCEQISQTSIRVRCNTKRELAHQFYLKNGYKLLKEQKVFENK